MSLNLPDPIDPLESLQDISLRLPPGQAFLADVIQIYCQGNKSGQIVFSAVERGEVYLQHGQLIHAACGVCEGEEAIYLMLQWGPGVFTFSEGILPHKRTISNNHEQILIEGALRADRIQQGLDPDPFPKASYSPPSSQNALISSRTQGGQPRVTVLSGIHLQVDSFDIDKDYVSVGRIPGNDIILPDPSVSSRHAMFVRSGNDILVRDLNSSNGTYVNDVQISETILQLEDVIQIGDVKMKFESSVRRPKLSGAKPLEQSPHGSFKTVPLAKKTPVTTTAMRKSGTQAGPSAPSSRPLSYKDLAAPVPGEKRSQTIFIVLAAGVMIAAVIAYFVFLKH